MEEIKQNKGGNGHAPLEKAPGEALLEKSAGNYSLSALQRCRARPGWPGPKPRKGARAPAAGRAAGRPGPAVGASARPRRAGSAVGVSAQAPPPDVSPRLPRRLSNQPGGGGGRRGGRGLSRGAGPMAAAAAAGTAGTAGVQAAEGPPGPAAALELWLSE